VCICGLDEDVHWFVDRIHAPNLYQVAHTPEEADRMLRSWAGKILKKGHMHLDMRIYASKILKTKVLNMVAICSNPDILHPSEQWFE
jgi:hypothetical protein